MNRFPENKSYNKVDELAQRLNWVSPDKTLLSQALIHRSYVNEQDHNLLDNERLEFLGDAVIDFIVGAWLFQRFPDAHEGELTKIRASLVCTSQLASFARKIKLGNYLMLGKGEEKEGGREKDAILCGGFESILGAVFLQADIKAVEEIILPFLEHTVNNTNEYLGISDHKSRLQEWSQGNGQGIPKYLLVATSGPDHERTFVVDVYVDGDKIGNGIGSSKQAAEQRAAQDALENIIKR